MPLNISPAAIAEKNKLSSTGAWILLFDVVFPSTVEVNLCINTEDIAWPVNGIGEHIPGVTKTYQAFPIEFDEVSESSNGERPQVELRVSNRTKALLPYIDEENGARGARVYPKLVHSKHLDNATPEVEFDLTCTRSGFDNDWVYFTLGTLNRRNRSVPKGRLMASFCRYPEFGGDRCGFPTGHASYDGAGCDRTKTRCRELWTQIGQAGNLKRFGGAPGVGESSYYD